MTVLLIIGLKYSGGRYLFKNDTSRDQTFEYSLINLDFNFIMLDIQTSKTN